jgi:hypothetical protein
VVLTRDRNRPFGARSLVDGSTQGSQSLTLGLILIAAPQLVNVQAALNVHAYRSFHKIGTAGALSIIPSQSQPAHQAQNFLALPAVSL